MVKKFIIELKGIPASSGQVLGKALVIKNPMKAPRQPNGSYIVVAEYTTPILNLLLSQAKGIICATGGVTMHAAVIAREFGIPCIVSVESIFEKIKKGQSVKINGSTGKIYVYNETKKTL